MSFEEAIPTLNTFVHFKDGDLDDQPMMVHYRTISGRVQPPKQGAEAKVNPTSPKTIKEDVELKFDPEEEPLPVKNTFIHYKEEEEQPMVVHYRTISGRVQPKQTREAMLKLVIAEEREEADDDDEPGTVTVLDGHQDGDEELITGGANRSTHERGECKPCAYFLFKADGCRKAKECDFCHYCTKEDAKRFKVMRHRDMRLAKKRQAAMLRGVPSDQDPQLSEPAPAAEAILPVILPLGPRLQSAPELGLVVKNTFIDVASQPMSVRTISAPAVSLTVHSSLDKEPAFIRHPGLELEVLNNRSFDPVRSTSSSVSARSSSTENALVVLGEATSECSTHEDTEEEVGQVTCQFSPAIVKPTPPPPPPQALPSIAPGMGFMAPPVGSLQCPSLGSLAHFTGSCRPCVGAAKGTCWNGVECTFCHLCGAERLWKCRQARKASKKQQVARA